MTHGFLTDRTEKLDLVRGLLRRFRQRKAEHAAVTYLAFHADLSSQPFHDATHNRKPQAMPFGARLPQLGKRQKEPRLAGAA